MPTYEYACKSCGKHIDVAQAFTDDPLTTCPTCGGALRKVFGNIAIAFKGSGFYKTDNRSVGKGTSAAKEPGASEGESKPEAAKEAAKDGSTPAAADTSTSTPTGNGSSNTDKAAKSDKPAKSEKSAAPS